jgi:methionine--tRNA ligase beta chain
VSETIKYDDFAKLVLKVGVIEEAHPHPDADKLMILKVDVGEPEQRQIVAGIRESYDPEDLINKRIVVVCNLEHRKVRGVVSEGMLLAASNDAADEDSEPFAIITTDINMDPGSVVK